jgi:HK97 family phage portal protein
MRLWPRRAEERTLTVAVAPGASPYFLPRAGTSTVTPTTAPLNPDVYACVRVLADAAASCPLITYRRRPDNERRRASGRTAELLEAPSPGTTQANFVSTVLSHLLLWGNAYIGKFRDDKGRIEQLLPLDPSQITVERRAGGVVFTVVSDGTPSEHSLDDICHVKALSTDGVVGFGPIAAMRATLDLNEATRMASTALFQNNARPSGIITSPRLSVEQAETLKAQWMAKHAGELSGGIAVVSGDLAFVPVSMPAADAQYIESRKLGATEVARVFRVPSWMISAESGDSMTYSNTEMQALAFVVFSLRPWLSVIEQALTADRDLFGPSLFCEFLIDSLLRADSRTRAEVYEKALNPVTGWMRRDEVRRAENLPPEEAQSGLDEVPVPSTNGEGVMA